MRKLLPKDGRTSWHIILSFQPKDVHIEDPVGEGGSTFDVSEFDRSDKAAEKAVDQKDVSPDVNEFVNTNEAPSEKVIDENYLNEDDDTETACS